MFSTRILNMDRPVQFFEDDTVDVVRQHIGVAADIHPDRLYILIGIELSRHYYTQDKRNWDLLFHRLSLDGRPLEREMFTSYCTEYRVPAISVPYKNYDHDEWMTYPEELHDLWDPSGEFTEYWIFGVEDQRSFCLPLTQSPLASRIISAESPIPDVSKLFMSFYQKERVRGFWVIPAEGAYTPLLRSVTPQKLPVSQMTLLQNNAQHVTELLSLDPPTPKKTSLLKAIWYVELVDTEIDHVRTRFEQMFYGLTVSAKLPCITFFTSQTEVSRHKFYTENVKTKKPLIDIPMWSQWWTKTKPPGSRPKLIVYRGKSREHFDRISISATDISFGIYRDSGETKDLETLREDLFKWFWSLDSITPFFKDTDLKKCRWSLQEIKFELDFSTSLEELDTRRLGCLSTVFDQDRKHPDVFKFLRTDYALEGLTVMDLYVIDLLKDNEFLTPQDIQQQLKITLDDSTRILSAIRSKLQDDPRLMERKARGFPLLQFLPTSVIVSSVVDIERPTVYASILRYILSDPKSKKLDSICPKKVETSESKVSVSQFEYNLDESFGDLFSYLEEAQPEQKAEEVKRVGKKSSKYSYFIKRLEEFDPKTFNPDHPNPDYPGACEQSHQPIALTKTELDAMPPEFDPRKTMKSEQILEWEDPEGIISCPEYWCMYDKLPLKKEQLVDGKACPVCGGKVRSQTDSKADAREFSVIPRTKGFSFAGYSKNPPISPANQKELPCCFRTEHKPKTLSTDAQEGKYYINRETKTQLEELRLAYVPSELLDVLDIQTDYTYFKKNGSRIPTGFSAFFRVGLQRSSQTISKLFDESQVPEPKDEVQVALNCSFLHSWVTPSTEHLEEIEEQMMNTSPFSTDELSRKKVATMISGMSKAFREGTMTQLQEVEYTCIYLGIDIYRVFLHSGTMGCVFYSQQVSGDKAILLLESGDEVDCLAFVSRKGRQFSYSADLKKKPFGDSTLKKLKSLRERACQLSIPTSLEALNAFQKIYPEDLPTLILDPFGRMQAFFYPGDLIIPFKNAPVPKDLRDFVSYESYIDIKDQLPRRDKMIVYLSLITEFHRGFALERELSDSEGQIVELLLQCGLRIPVVPEPGPGKPEDVLGTIVKEGESEFTFGSPNPADTQLYKTISYADEVYNFILFELTQDLEDGYPDLRTALSNTPVRKEVEPLLASWFSEKVQFAKLDTPIEFISKIRKPCGQFKSRSSCDNAHMCGWSGQCSVRVRDSINKDKLFNTVLTNILENSKTRYMILDGRTSPFFSTILYLELPHEKIVTDLEVRAGTV
jgi:hypothetical protein